MMKPWGIAVLGSLLALFGLSWACGVWSAGTDSADPRAEDARPAPELPKDGRWLQSDPLQWKDLKGRVVVLHFWTFGCVNCQRNYPVYKGWLKKYADQKVTILGVHTPEFGSEADVDRVKAKVRENGLSFPVLIDKKGKVRYRWEGELHLDQADAKRFAGHIDELLAEKE
jgi:thiol-disulfide isomerase/thioredoxin